MPFGALAGGWLAQGLQAGGMDPAESYRTVMWVFPGCGVLLFAMTLGLDSNIEVESAAAAPTGPSVLGLSQSRGIVLRLSGLFAVDAFGGGFIVQSFIAWWFHVRFGASPGEIGSLFFGANLLSGGIKAAYDIALCVQFRRLRPPEEQQVNRL